MKTVFVSQLGKLNRGSYEALGDYNTSDRLDERVGALEPATTPGSPDHEPQHVDRMHEPNT